MRMLTPAPYKALVKKDKKKKSKEAEGGLHHEDTSGAMSGGTEAPSSHKGDEDEDEEGEDGKDDASYDGADSWPQPDQVSTNELRAGEPTAAGADQAETNQTAVPPPGASTSADPSDPAAAPLA